MSPEKIAVLAKALGVSQKTLIGSVQSGTALPTSETSVLGINDIIRNLWEKNADSDAFVLGSKLLISEDKPDYRGRHLLGSWFGSSSSLAQGVSRLLHPDKPVDIVLQELQDLYKKMVQSGLVRYGDWQYTILCILTQACNSLGIYSSQFITIAQVAIEKNWLDPVNCPVNGAAILHSLLKKLDAVKELKPLVQHLLKDWYVHFLGRKDMDSCIRKILGDASPLALPMCSGHSPTLEDGLKIDNLTPSWTEEPEGVPDIGRLLTGLPAFSVFKTRTSRHRPVIWFGNPRWDHESLNKKAYELSKHHYQHCPDKEARHERLTVSQYSELIKEAFADYVYQTAHVNGGGVTVCWFNALAGSAMHQM
ncbi:hypothetical protein, partial [Sansalvadorimonas verongulae]|uniref:hypothetical protein n=1 Tax=Sansalvadorimonas verongulae TaxID=2172824 RepID=UPI001E60B5EB